MLYLCGRQGGRLSTRRGQTDCRRGGDSNPRYRLSSAVSCVPSGRWVIQERLVARSPSKLMRCSKCGMENPVGKKFCSQCGNGLSGCCPKCGAENLLSSRFCGDCGATLAGNVSPAAAQSPNAASTAAQIRVTTEQPDA